jgi:lysophospholipase L1-like esterase
LGNIPSGVLREFAAQRPYDLIIFHFGLNVANENVRNYKPYIQQLGNVIRRFKAAYPQTSILIVSMTDRDQRSMEGIHTMQGVESLVGYQQIMAANQRVAFFNLFQAMGGRESMKTLVDKGLANKDYTHISHAGGRRLATHLVESILAGFDIYKNSNSHE